MRMSKEGMYYAEYLGWKESKGLVGREFTEPIIRELLARRRTAELPKMTIQLSPEEVLISQQVINKGAKPEKMKYPAIPTKDVTFVIQALYPDNDVVACIFLGYNPYTKCAVHVHVYRFDSEATASLFVKQLSAIIEREEYKERIIGIEKDLAELGYINLRDQQNIAESYKRRSAGSDGYSYGTTSPRSSDSSVFFPTAEDALRQRHDIIIQKSKKQPEPDQKTKKLFASLQEEFEYKIHLEEAPILLPPKDYDTIVRRHGHLQIREEIRAASRSSIVGPNGIFKSNKAIPYKGPVEFYPDGVYLDGSSYIEPFRNGDSVKQKPQSKSTLPDQENPNELRRQSSFASSELSNNSDEYFADGLYQGYRPKSLMKTKSKDDSGSEDGSLLAMWSPSYSFGQTGVRSLPTHHEEEDHLNRTAPASMLLTRHDFPPSNETQYIITQRGEDLPHHVRRSNSHNKRKSKKS